MDKSIINKKVINELKKELKRYKIFLQNEEMEYMIPSLPVIDLFIDYLNIQYLKEENQNNKQE